MKQRGVTLVELLVVISIIGILAIALGFSYVGWRGKYKVENEIKTLYAALTDARSRAMYTGQDYFMDISTDGRFYRITQDDSDGTAKGDGDGIFQAQATWAAIQPTNPANWGGVAATKDTTVTALSRRLELTNNPPTTPGYFVKENSGLLYALFVAPKYLWTFRLGFDKRGIIRNMTFSVNSSGDVVYTPATNITDAVPSDHDDWHWGHPTICIYTDYDGNGTSDYDPDYDCIVTSDTGIRLGKVVTQNTYCYEANCVAK